MRVKKMITYCIILLIISNPKKKITPCVKKRDPVCVGFFLGGGGGETQFEPKKAKQ